MFRYKHKTNSTCLFSFAELAEGDGVSTIYSRTWFHFFVLTYLEDIKTEQLTSVNNMVNPVNMGGKR